MTLLTLTVMNMYSIFRVANFQNLRSMEGNYFQRNSRSTIGDIELYGKERQTILQ